MKLATLFFSFFLMFHGIPSAWAGKDWQLSWLDTPQEMPTLTLKNLSDEEVELTLDPGVPTIVTFWATWCPPCIQEMPSLLTIPEKFKKQQLRLILISVDKGGEAIVAPFWKEQKWREHEGSYTDATMRVMRQLKVQGMPTSFLIKEGKIIGKIEGGADWKSPSITTMLKTKLLNKHSAKQTKLR